MSEQTLVRSEVQQPTGADVMPTSDVFLLNPANRGFLLGKSRRIGDRVLLRETLPFVALIPFILLGLWAMTQMVSAVSDWSRLNQPDAVTATGTITERHVSTGKSTSYSVTYRFYDHDQPHEREQMVNLSTYSRLVEGAQTTIKYLPGDPRISSLGGSDSDNTYVISLIVATVLFIPLLVFMLISMRTTLLRVWPKVERKRQLAREGKILKGQVLSSFASTSGGNYRLTVRYSFQSPKGHEVIKMASRKRNDLKEADLPKAGTPVAILYVNSKCLELL